MAAFGVGEFRQAVAYWNKVKAADSTDMLVLSKLVQAYQALEMVSDRESARKELFAVRNSGKGHGLADNDAYVREQLVVAGRNVMVFEHFELKGDRALRYVFYVLDDEGKPDFRISLGSYSMTNAVWRETTKPKPKEDERLFHLDGYYGASHATHGMFAKEPTYDDTRAMVKGILEKRLKPTSSNNDCYT